MSDTTTIAWTNATWNPLAGCTRVSAGCDNCYAAKMAATRLKHTPAYEGLATITPSGVAAFTGKIRLLPDRLDQPLRWRKPRRVFVNSMSDLFHEDVPDLFILEVWLIMAMASEHVFQVLTKRPERMRELLSRQWMPDSLAEPHRLFADDMWPLPNVWLGTSVENQAAADERIPLLLQTPAAVRFVSAEPLLGPVDFTMLNMGKRDGQLGEFDQYLDAMRPSHTDGMGFERDLKEHHRLHWVIVGGESGPRHRPLDLAWAHSIREQCRAAGVAYFGKQTSGYRSGIELPDEGGLSDQEYPK